MNLRWYARRRASMSPAELAGRGHDELVRWRWRSRQVVDAGTDQASLPAACPPFAARLPAAGDIDTLPEAARVPLVAGEDLDPEDAVGRAVQGA